LKKFDWKDADGNKIKGGESRITRYIQTFKHLIHKIIKFALSLGTRINFLKTHFILVIGLFKATQAQHWTGSVLDRQEVISFFCGLKKSMFLQAYTS